MMNSIYAHLSELETYDWKKRGQCDMAVVNQYLVNSTTTTKDGYVKMCERASACVSVNSFISWLFPIEWLLR